MEQLDCLAELGNHAALNHILATGTIKKACGQRRNGNIPQLRSRSTHFGRAQALVQIGKDRQQMRLRHGAAIKPHYGAYHLLICRTLGAHKRLKDLGNACQTIAHPLGGNNARLTAMANDLSQMNNKLLPVIRDNRRILCNKRRGRCSGSMCAPTRNGHRFAVGTGRDAARDGHSLTVGARSARHRDSFACRRSTRA